MKMYSISSTDTCGKYLKYRVSYVEVFKECIQILKNYSNILLFKHLTSLDMTIHRRGDINKKQ